MNSVASPSRFCSRSPAPFFPFGISAHSATNAINQFPWTSSVSLSSTRYSGLSAAPPACLTSLSSPLSLLFAGFCSPSPSNPCWLWDCLAQGLRSSVIVIWSSGWPWPSQLRADPSCESSFDSRSHCFAFASRRCGFNAQALASERCYRLRIYAKA